MYILRDKHLYSDDEIESIMSPITEEPKLLEEEKGYKVIKRGPIGIAIKNFWTLFGFFSYFLIAAIIIGFIAWCFWVRKKADEKRRKMERTRTIESSGNSASEDEELSIGSGADDFGVVFGANIGGGGNKTRKKKKKDKIKKTGNKKTKSQKESKTNKSKIKSKTKGRK